MVSLTDFYNNVKTFVLQTFETKNTETSELSNRFYQFLDFNNGVLSINGTIVTLTKPNTCTFQVLGTNSVRYVATGIPTNYHSNQSIVITYINGSNTTNCSIFGGNIEISSQTNPNTIASIFTANEGTLIVKIDPYYDAINDIYYQGLYYTATKPANTLQATVSTTLLSG